MAIEVEAFLGGLGYQTETSKAEAWLTLEEAGLVPARRRTITRRNIPKARRLLVAKDLRICGGVCSYVAEKLLQDRRSQLVVLPRQCQVCLGSNNRQAAGLMQASLIEAGVGKVLIVGGFKKSHDELRRLLRQTTLKFRYIDGLKSAGQKTADLQAKWADLVVVWGSQPLKHSLSNNYTKQASSGEGLVVLHKRGIEALCLEVVRYCVPERSIFKI